MAYRHFTPPTVPAVTPATVATTATLAGQTVAKSQMSHGVASAASEPSVANVASNDDAAEFEERAALVQYGAEVPRSWAEGFGRLDLASPPRGFSKDRWRGLINDAGVFLDNWANEAAACGWSVSDVFGVDAAAPAARFDRMGLVPPISGGAVVAIDVNCATIRTATGGILRYRRTALRNAVPVWQLSRPRA